MHKTVALVFKVLGISIFLMILLDSAYLVSDTITVNNRIESTAVVIQDELSRNNAIPDSIAPLFLNQIKTIQEKSNIVSQDANGIVTNIDRDITVDGVLYKAISEANVKDYGEELTLVIQVTMEPKSMVFYRDSSKNGGSFLGRKTFSYTSTYLYQVPALRYLK